MTVVDMKLDREDRRRAQRAGVEALEASGALDELYSMIDAGDVQLDGKDELIQQLIKAGLERGLRAELSDHLGYDKGDPEAGFVPELAQWLVPQDRRDQCRRRRAGDPA